MGDAAVRAERETVAARLWRALRCAGVHAIYGDAGRGLPVTAAAPPDLARLLVAAHERVHHARAATWLDGVLTLGTPAPRPTPTGSRLGGGDFSACGVGGTGTGPGRAPGPGGRPGPGPGAGAGGGLGGTGSDVYSGGALGRGSGAEGPGGGGAVASGGSASRGDPDGPTGRGGPRASGELGEPAAGWLVLLDEAERVAEMVGIAASAAAAGRGVSVRVDLDLAQPAGAAPAIAPGETPAVTDGRDAVLARLVAAQQPVVLAGPGVVTAGAVPALHAFATAGQVGVLNTWGAKGIFAWQSPHHWATIGLQRDDFRLAGLADADLIVAVGVDRDESPAARWQLAPHVTVAPGDLGALAETWRRPAGLPPMPPLRRRLAEATQAGWPIDTAPLPPSRVTRAYGEIAGRGGLIAADPGIAGFWVARTVGTTVLDSVVVPAADVGPGFAVAAALVARIASPARPVLAVLDAPGAHDVHAHGAHGARDGGAHGVCGNDAGGARGSDAEDSSRTGRRDGRGAGDLVGALRELSASLGLPVPVEVWTDDGPALDADAHARRLRDAVYGETAAELRLRTDDRWLARMTDVAGPVIAWNQRTEGGTNR